MTTNGLHHQVASRAELELDRGMQAADRIAKQAEARARLSSERMPSGGSPSYRGLSLLLASRSCALRRPHRRAGPNKSRCVGGD